MSEQKKNTKKNEKLTALDAILAVFYLVIIVVGINLCMSRGQNANFSHLAAVTISVWGVLAVKIAKYRKNLKDHLGDVVFVAILSVLSLFAVITSFIM